VRPYLEKPFTKMGLVEWLKVKPLSSRPSTTKKLIINTFISCINVLQYLKIRSGRLEQEEGPEFKPQYCQRP
jgi:hypothetical protein